MARDITSVDELLKAYAGLTEDVAAPGRMLLFQEGLRASKIEYTSESDPIGHVTKWRGYRILLLNDALVMAKEKSGFFSAGPSAHAFPITKCQLWRRPQSEKLAPEERFVLRLRCEGVLPHELQKPLGAGRLPSPGPGGGLPTPGSTAPARQSVLSTGSSSAAPGRHEREYAVVCASEAQMERLYAAFQAIRNPLVSERERKPVTLLGSPAATATALADLQKATTSPHSVSSGLGSAGAPSPAGAGHVGAAAMPGQPPQPAGAGAGGPPLRPTSVGAGMPPPSAFFGAKERRASTGALPSSMTGAAFPVGGHRASVGDLGSPGGIASSSRLRAHVHARASLHSAGLVSPEGALSVSSATSAVSAMGLTSRDTDRSPAKTPMADGSSPAAQPAAGGAAGGAGAGPAAAAAAHTAMADTLRRLEERLKSNVLRPGTPQAGSSSASAAGASAFEILPGGLRSSGAPGNVNVATLPGVPPMLSSVTASLAPDTAEEASNAKHRHAVYTEILETEKRYVADLQVLRDVFLQPLREEARSSKPILPELSIAAIFSNVETILDVNASLLLALCAGLDEAAGRSSSTAGTVDASRRPPLSDVFAEAFTRVMPFFRLYSTYCKNYWVALDLVKRETGSNERLQEFLSYCAVKPETRRQDLGSFLIKPVQRICKYPLFFRDLLRHMPAAHPNRAKVEAALAEVDRIAGGVNERLQAEERAALIVDAWDLIDRTIPDLVQPQRQLVLDLPEVDLTFPHSVDKGGFAELFGWSTSAAKAFRLFLFSDMLLLTRFSHVGARFPRGERGSGGPDSSPAKSTGGGGGGSDGGVSHLVGWDSNRRYKVLESLLLKDVVINSNSAASASSPTPAGEGSSRPMSVSVAAASAPSPGGGFGGAEPDNAIKLTASKPAVGKDGLPSTAVLSFVLHFATPAERDRVAGTLQQAISTCMELVKSLEARRMSANPGGTRAWKRSTASRSSKGGLPPMSGGGGMLDRMRSASFHSTAPTTPRAGSAAAGDGASAADGASFAEADDREEEEGAEPVADDAAAAAGAASSHAAPGAGSGIAGSAAEKPAT